MTEQSLPRDRSYTKDHEWIAIPPGGGLPDDAVRIGLSAAATDALGEVVFLELPEPGTKLTAGETCGEVESTKSVSELFSPVSGTVAEINPALVDNPSLVNEDPHGEGWLFSATVTALGDLLTVDEYQSTNEG
jgi:glycine cleavage system H protein